MKRRFYLSVAAGLIWGLVAMALNGFTSVFAFEGSFAHNLISFTLGGVLFGLVSGGALYFLGGLLPLKGYLIKALVVTTALWLLLRGAGVLLSAMEPTRYSVIGAEALQGLVLAVALGAILGTLWSLMESGEVLD